MNNLLNDLSITDEQRQVIASLKLPIFSNKLKCDIAKILAEYEKYKDDPKLTILDLPGEV